MSNDYVKLFVRLPEAQDSFGSESFWGVPLGEGLYRVDNLLICAPFTLDDVVRANENGQVLEVVSRTDKVTIGISAPCDADESDIAALAAHESAFRLLCTEAGKVGKIERFGPTTAALQISDVEILDLDFDEKIQSLLDAILDAADIAYDLLRVDWALLSTPQDPLGSSGIDASPPEEESYSGDPWHPWEDTDFLEACLKSAETESIPSWLEGIPFLSGAYEAYLRDPRVRDAVANREFDDIITLVVRMSAIRKGIPVPDLERPLFDKAEARQHDAD